ncbi:MAG TPA: hypothetical protein VNA27_11780 [Rubrobacteraceae bacterium]|nr:hypothetical protein [Rubrobacteraceae bacterium]
MSVHKRLEKLEAQASDADSQWVILIEVPILAKAVERHQARNDGREPPPYAQEKIEEMRRYDLEIEAGGGVVGQFREAAVGSPKRPTSFWTTGREKPTGD